MKFDLEELQRKANQYSTLKVEPTIPRPNFTKSPQTLLGTTYGNFTSPTNVTIDNPGAMGFLKPQTPTKFTPKPVTLPNGQTFDLSSVEAKPEQVVPDPNKQVVNGNEIPKYIPQKSNEYSYGQAVLGGLLEATPNFINWHLANAAAIKDYELASQMVAPTTVGAQVIAPRIDYGASKSRLASNASRVRSNAAQQTTSDATQNAIIRAMGEDQAKQYEDQIGQLQEQEVNANTQAQAQAANQQSAIDAEVANRNSQSNAFVMNNLINAKRTLNQAVAGNTIQAVDAISDTVTSATNDYNAEAVNRQKAQDANNFNNELTALGRQAKDASVLDNYSYDFGDNTSYDFGNGITVGFTGNRTWGQVQEELNKRIGIYNKTTANPVKLDDILQTDKGKALQKLYLDQQESRLKGLTNQAYDLTRAYYSKYYPTMANSLPMSGYRQPQPWLKGYYKNGGKTPRDRELDRWVRLAMLNQKKQIAEKEQTIKAQIQASKNLNEALKKLSAEEQILLRSVFK